MDALEAAYQLLEQQRAQGLDDWQIFEQLLERQRHVLPDFAPLMLIYQIYSILDSEASHSANT